MLGDGKENYEDEGTSQECQGPDGDDRTSPGRGPGACGTRPLLCTARTGLPAIRHDISDGVWEVLEPHPPGRAGVRGVTAQDNRLFINAVFGICVQGLQKRAF